MDDFGFTIEETTGSTVSKKRSSSPHRNGSARTANVNGVSFTTDTIFTTGQIAKIFKVAPRTVSKWFDAGSLKGHRIPNSQDRRIPYANAVEFARDYDQPMAYQQLTEHLDAAQGLFLYVGEEIPFQSFRNSLTNKERAQRINSAFELGGVVVSTHIAACILDATRIGTEMTNQLAQQLFDLDSNMLLVALRDDECGSLNRALFRETFRKPFEAALLAQRVESLVS